MKNKIVKNQNLDAVKFCFGRDSNLAEGGLRFLLEDQEKSDVILNKFLTNFLGLVKSSEPYFPKLMRSIPKDMKSRFQSVEDLEGLQDFYRAFNQFFQVFRNVCQQINLKIEELSRKIENEEKDEDKKTKKQEFLKNGLINVIPAPKIKREDPKADLKGFVIKNFVLDKSANSRFEIFSKKLSGYIKRDFSFEDRRRKQTPFVQKIIAAAIDSFIENPRTPDQINKNLQLIFGRGRNVSDLLYQDLSNLSVEEFMEGYAEFIDEHNRVASNILAPKMELPKENTEDKKSAPEEKTGAAPEEKTGAAPEEKTGAAPEEKTGAAPEEKTGAAPEEKNLWDMMISGNTKNFRKTKVDPRAKKIKKQLDSLNSNWTAINANPDEQYKLNFLKDLRDLRDSLSDIKLERKNLKSQDLIVERWIKMAGLEDKHE